MIRYNANSPEILGKKQYDVLRGFGRWCVFVGIAGVVCAGDLIITIGRNEYWRVGNGNFYLWTHITWLLVCACCSSLFVLWGLYAMNGILKVSVPARLGTASVLSVLVCVLPALYEMIFEFRFIGSILGYIVICTFYSFVAYFLWGIVKLFCQTDVILVCTNKNKISKEEPSNKGDTSIIQKFVLWDPLYFYGVFARSFGFVFGFLGIILLVFFIYETSLNMSGFEKQVVMYMLLFTAFSIIIGVVGYGLAKRKEWARTLSVLFHSAILFLMLYGVCHFMNYQPYYVLDRLSLCLLCLVVSHWCYFVIRTLSSPVVKYVCLRGGHDIA